MKVKITLLLLLVLIILTACESNIVYESFYGEKYPDLTPNTSPSTTCVVPSGTVKIHLIGDSITQGYYRYALFQHLVDAGYDFDYVGTADDIPEAWKESELAFTEYKGIPFDSDHDGHGGWTTKMINEDINTWFKNFTPDIALIHLGTNDTGKEMEGLLANQIANSVAEMDDIIGKLRAVNPHITIFLAQIIPVHSEGVEHNEFVQQLNHELALLAANLTIPTSPIIIVDMFTDFGDADLVDALHPNTQGARKMAQRWSDALLACSSHSSE